MKREKSIDIICFNCKHFDSVRIGGCKAFPGQIPELILTGQSNHLNHIKGQEGDYVYTPIEKPMKIWRRFDTASRPPRKSPIKLKQEKWL